MGGVGGEAAHLRRLDGAQGLQEDPEVVVGDVVAGDHRAGDRTGGGGQDAGGASVRHGIVLGVLGGRGEQADRVAESVVLADPVADDLGVVEVLVRLVHVDGHARQAVTPDVVADHGGVRHRLTGNLGGDDHAGAAAGRLQRAVVAQRVAGHQGVGDAGRAVPGHDHTAAAGVAGGGVPADLVVAAGPDVVRDQEAAALVVGGVV